LENFLQASPFIVSNHIRSDFLFRDPLFPFSHLERFSFSYTFFWPRIPTFFPLSQSEANVLSSRVDLLQQEVFRCKLLFVVYVFLSINISPFDPLSRTPRRS